MNQFCTISYYHEHVATRLLEAEIPLEIISNVMGHMTLESTQIYMKVDVEVLRSAALDLEVSDG